MIVVAGVIVGVSTGSSSFVCTSAISNAQAKSILGVPARVVTGGGGADDCGIDARGFNHIIITGYVVKRSFFDNLRRSSRSGPYESGGYRGERTQRPLKSFGGPAFSVEWKLFGVFGESAPPQVTRSVFVYRNGRMLRPVTTGPRPGKVASMSQVVRIARVLARSV